MNKKVILILIILWCAKGAITAQTPELVVQAGHAFGVTVLAISPDGKLLASGSNDEVIILWEINTGRKLRALAGNKEGGRRRNENVLGISFTADGKTILYGTHAGRVGGWDVATGKERPLLEPQRERVSALAFSPDGKQVAMGKGRGAIAIYDLESRQLIRNMSGDSGEINALTYSNDKKFLVSSGIDRTTKLWNLETDKSTNFRDHQGIVQAVAVSKDGRFLASGGKDEDVRLRRLGPSGEAIVLGTQGEPLTALAFSADGKMLASGGENGTIKLWDVVGRRELALPGDREIGHDNETVFALAFDATGKFLFSGSSDKTTALWEVSTGKERRTFGGAESAINALAYRPDGKVLALGCDDDVVRLWELGTDHELHLLRGHTDEITSVAFSSDSQYLVSGGKDNKVKLWDIEGEKELFTFEHTEVIAAVAFGPKGVHENIIASAGYDRKIRFWNARTKAPFFSPLEHSNGVTALAFSPDGTWLASASQDSKIWLWEAATGKKLWELAVKTTRDNSPCVIKSLAFSPDGNTLLVGMANDKLRYWNLTTKAEILKPGIKNTNVHAIASGTAAANIWVNGGETSVVSIVDANNDSEVQLAGHAHRISSLALSPQAKHVVSVSKDNTVKAWDIAARKLLATLYLAGEKDWALIDPDGRFDGSSNGRQTLHYVVGTETFSLEQMKDRYWQPELMLQLLSRERLSLVPRIAEMKLPPRAEMHLLPNDTSRVQIDLTNRGGGIGPVRVLVNGIEMTDDATRLISLSPDAATARITIDLLDAGHHKPGEKNIVQLETWSNDHFLSEKSEALIWEALGRKGDKSTLYAIVAGVSKYSGPKEEKMDLHYAADGARKMANAIFLGARNLFDPDKIKIRLLISDDRAPVSSSDYKEEKASKENFKRAFADIQAAAKPQDVFVIFLSGHGLSLEGAGNEYCYPTADAPTLKKEVLADPVRQQEWVIKGSEISAWLSKIKANKRVLILDTCEAGAIETALAWAKGSRADVIKSLDRLNNNQGIHVLMGAAIGKQSYEGAPYQSDLLTYALMKGIKGAALNGEEVDVSRLFSYASEEVRSLAHSLSIEQHPRILLKENTFPLGRIKERDAILIELPSPKLVLVAPDLRDSDKHRDVLRLGEMLGERLQEEWEAGRIHALYQPESRFPEAVKLSGAYKAEAGKIYLRFSLYCKQNGKDWEYRDSVEAQDIPHLLDKLVAQIKDRLAELAPK